MKKIYKFIFIFLFSNMGFAQTPELLDTPWYLSDLVLDGTSYLPPSNSEVEYIPMDILDNGSQTGLSTQVCNGGAAEITFANDTFSFETFVSTLIMCTIPSNNSYEYLYFGFFWAHVNENITYIITGTGDNMVLTLLAPNGDRAIYSNNLLSSPEYNNVAFILYPNPARDLLMIQNLPDTLNSGIIEIYNIIGSICYTEKFQAAPSHLNIQNLSAGSYILKIRNDKTVMTRKFVKL